MSLAAYSVCDLRATHWRLPPIFPCPGEHIHGLTTADCTWLTACVGVVCGVAEWRVIFVGVPLVFAVLLLGGRIEEEIDRRFHAAALIRGVIWHASGWPLIGLVRRWKETRSPTAGEYSATTQARRKNSTAPESSSAWMTPHPVSGLYILI
jgi:hypothetical protein